METGVYRIVQEALANATKHGEATHLGVSVIEDGAQVRVTVRDDGHGFDTGQTTAGFGLAGMRERVELLSGDLSVESASGQGTTVTASLPVIRRDGAEAHLPAPTVAPEPEAPDSLTPAGRGRARS
jgi:signal transduction histidine kinase